MGKTSPEIVYERADANKSDMGLTSHRGPIVRKSDITVAKNYLSEDELRALNNLVEQYLLFAEGQAMRRIPMRMADWAAKLDSFLQLNDRGVLSDAGKVSRELADQTATSEFEKYENERREASGPWRATSTRPCDPSSSASPTTRDEPRFHRK